MLWCTKPQALGRQRKVDLCEIEASPVYKVNSRTARAIAQRNPALEEKVRSGGWGGGHGGGGGGPSCLLCRPATHLLFPPSGFHC